MNNNSRLGRLSITSGVFLATLLGMSNGQAQMALQTEENACATPGTYLIYFNGVGTTRNNATRALLELRRIHGTRSPDGKNIRYEVLYNQTNNLAVDVLETFEQRLNEQDALLAGRFELFFGALRGGDSWWSRIVSDVPGTGSLLASFGDWYLAKRVGDIARSVANPPTAVDSADHQARIATLVTEGQRLLFVAHSQGNLFANAAYDYALTKTRPDGVKVVHVAPASPRLVGAHTLADQDLIINGLRVFGTVASVTKEIPNYLVRPPGLNNQRDFWGHGFLEIYLNRSLLTSSEVKGNINSALTALVSPPRQAIAGFFTASLTWDGQGDVDLHVYEPDSTHVYYRNKQGTSGYLDIDEVTAFGPEHYYATCDVTKLQTGSYSVHVANYEGAAGRVATLQIGSSSYGVLDTNRLLKYLPPA